MSPEKAAEIAAQIVIAAMQIGKLDAGSSEVVDK